MEYGVDEVMTCHQDLKIYGSIWAISTNRLRNYGDPYKPTPQVLIVDSSTDIHTTENFNEAILQLKQYAK
jgi:hypothetical protein